jgi:hypothetical protein
MVLQNPPAVQRMILDQYGWWNLWLGAVVLAIQVPGELNSLESAPRVKAPAIFVMSETDQTVPFKFQKKVADSYAGEKQIVLRKSAGHNSPMDGDDAVRLQKSLDWLWSRAVPDGRPGP